MPITSIEDLNFTLPKELIAYQPCAKRDHSQLMVVSGSKAKQDLVEAAGGANSTCANQNQSSQSQLSQSAALDSVHDGIQITKFFNIVQYLQPGDLLVLNNTKVINAKLVLNTIHGKKVTIYLDSKCSKGNWHAFAKPSKLLTVGDELHTPQDNRYKFTVLKKGERGRIKLACLSGDINTILDLYGQVPLPPYIKKEVTTLDKERYQTIFSKNPGSVAAPTAGLHFTHQLLETIANKKIDIAFITLHVGSGTFLPIKENIESHVMHQENGFIEEEDARLINQAHEQGRRVIAVGSTVLRTLEYMMHNFNHIKQGNFSTDLFIKSGFEFKIVDLLITNFHLPKSTLLLLVKAFAGENLVDHAYQYAIAHKMRFFSYGDAMLLYRLNS